MNQIFNHDFAAAHDAEISSSRVGGFGGSDAQLFLNISRKGIDKISKTDAKRIAVAMGLADYVGSPDNKWTRAGHTFEEHIDAYMHNTGKPYERERYIDGHEAERFKTFAHADFVVPGVEDTYTVIECKFVQKPMAEVLAKYEAQLQWYYMLGATSVELMHGQGTPEDEGQAFTISEIGRSSVLRNDAIIEELRDGIKILDDAIFAGWQPVLADDEEMPEELQLLFAQAVYAKEQRDLFDGQLKKYTAELRKYMEQVGATKYYSQVEDATHTITLGSASTTRSFDSAAFLDEHPEYNLAKYYKETTKKGSLIIK